MKWTVEFAKCGSTTFEAETEGEARAKMRHLIEVLGEGAVAEKYGEKMDIHTVYSEEDIRRARERRDNIQAALEAEEAELGLVDEHISQIWNRVRAAAPRG